MPTIDDFLDNCNEEGCCGGWVAKLHFVTNQIVKELKTKSEVIKKLRSIFSNDSQGILYIYAMIQPCMKNRNEYKVVQYIPSKSKVYVSSSTTIAGNYKKSVSNEQAKTIAISLIL